MKNKKGQIVIVLLLTMLVALAIGLTITQRSITDVATSSQTEQSSRAFSAAEAGIEKALSAGDLPLDIPSFDLGNQSKAEVKVADSLPRPKQALEFPPVGKEKVAQFWLSNINQPFGQYYFQNQIDVYFGSIPVSPVQPAVEINLIYKNTADKYVSKKYFVDPDSARRLGSNPGTYPNGFEPCSVADPVPMINTTSSQNFPLPENRRFLCKYTVNFVLLTNFRYPVIIKARVLYSDKSERIAVKPYLIDPSCTSSPSPYIVCSLPPQATIYTSIGTAGQSQKTLQVYKAKMIPLFFDYAIFSTGAIEK